MSDLPLDQLEAHRTALTGHCYRMLASITDAEDAVQDTMVRALRALPTFDGRSSLRTWLYRIATNVCIDALGERGPRVRACDERPVGTVDEEVVRLPSSHWVEPAPDTRVLPAEADPAERVILRQSIRLAFVAALQRLPPKQRAALLLTDVLDFSAAEAAKTLGTSVASINSALQRARATLAARAVDQAPVAPERESALVDRYMDAFERYDTEALVALLHEDVIMSMPPKNLWLQGRAAVRAWFLGSRGCGCRGSRLVRTRACDAPAFGQYRPSAGGGYHAWAIIVLELSEQGVAHTTSFLEVEALFPTFGLPLELPA